MKTESKCAPGAQLSVSAIDLLDAAAGHMKARAATYDSPGGERSMAQTVAIFNLHHGTQITEAQGWHFMRILKDVRLFTREGYHSDSAEDGVAYQSLMAEAKAKEALPQEPDKKQANKPLPVGEWIKWDGVGIPDVRGDFFVAARTARGLTMPAKIAAEWEWNHIGDETDIVEFMIAADQNGVPFKVSPCHENPLGMNAWIEFNGASRVTEADLPLEFQMRHGSIKAIQTAHDLSDFLKFSSIKGQIEEERHVVAYRRVG